MGCLGGGMVWRGLFGGLYGLLGGVVRRSLWAVSMTRVFYLSNLIPPPRVGAGLGC